MRNIARSAAATLCLLAATGAVTQDGLIAHWTFDEGTGRLVRDRSGNRVDAFLLGGTWGKGKRRSAFRFNGLEDYVFCGGRHAKLTADKALTMTVWVNPEGANQIQYVMGKYGCSVLVGPRNHVMLEVRDAAKNDWHRMKGPIVPLDDWAHLAVTCRARGEAVIYVNGEIKAREKTPFTSAGGAVLFGRPAHYYWYSQRGISSNYRGLITEAKLYNRVLSPTEVKRNYTTERGKIDSTIPTRRGQVFIKPRLLFIHGRIDVALDLTPLGRLPKEARAEIGIAGKREEGIAAKTVEIPEEADVVKATFPTKLLKAGGYSIRARIVKADGRAIGTPAHHVFTWMDRPRWLDSNAGVTDKIPAPWTPVKAIPSNVGLLVRMSGRQYTFSGSPLPSKIETAGASILAGPVRFVAKVNGRAVRFRSRDDTVNDHSDSRVILRNTSRGGPLSLTATTVIEYDGLMKIDWMLKPRRHITLDSLTFEMPVKAAYGTLHYIDLDYAHCPWSVKNGGNIPKQGILVRFKPVAWVGDEERGLMWVCESDKNWYVQRQNEVLQIAREGDQTVLRLHLVNVPLPLAPGGQDSSGNKMPDPKKGPLGNLAYTFGLQATPIKPIERDVWDFRFAHIGQPKTFDWLFEPVGHEKIRLDYLAEKGVRTLGYHEHWTDWYGCTTTRHSEKLKRMVEECHKRGIKVNLYIGYMMSDLCAEYPLFNEECLTHPKGMASYLPFLYEPQPPQNAWTYCVRSRWQDYIVDGIARMVDEYDIDGIYLDGVHNPRGGCRNSLHGCGYTRPDGNIGNTFPMFHMRELYKRMYVAIRSRKPHGQVDTHASGFLNPAVGFATSVFDGEHLMAGHIPKGGYALDRIPLDLYRAEFLGRNWGTPVEFLRRLVNLQDSLSIALLHDTLPGKASPGGDMETLAWLWKLSDEFGRKEAEWLPYWKNSDYVTVTPQGTDDKPAGYVSLYRHPKNGVLAVISNLGPELRKIRVHFNMEKLGLKSGVLGLFVGLRTTVPARIVSGTVEVELKSLGWRILQLKSAPETPRARRFLIRDDFSGPGLDKVWTQTYPDKSRIKLVNGLLSVPHGTCWKIGTRPYSPKDHPSGLSLVVDMGFYPHDTTVTPARPRNEDEWRASSAFHPFGFQDNEAGVGKTYARFTVKDMDNDWIVDAIEFQTRDITGNRLVTVVLAYNPRDRRLHRYRIVWRPNEIAAYFDENLVAVHKMSIPKPLWVVGRNESAGGTVFDNFELGVLPAK